MESNINRIKSGSICLTATVIMLGQQHVYIHHNCSLGCERMPNMASCFGDIDIL